MRKNPNWEKFLKTGRIKDYLNYRKEKVEFAKEVVEKNDKYQKKESRSCPEK